MANQERSRLIPRQERARPTAMRGKFITIEGQDGAGKSTNLDHLAELIREQGIDLVITREPGGTTFGERVRSLVLGSTDQDFGEMAELLMIFAARAQHLEEVILPALNEGSWVLCDRFTDATYAYQGGGRDMGAERISILEDLVQEDIRPDHTFLLDVPVETGEQRAGNRSAPDRFERQAISFKQKVRQCYLQRASAEPNRFSVIDAAKSLDDVKADIETAFLAFIKETLTQSVQPD